MMVSKRDQIADRPPRLAAHELGHVGVLLLRHQARAGRVGVGQLDEAELGASTRGRAPRRVARGGPSQIAAAARSLEGDVAGATAVHAVARRVARSRGRAAVARGPRGSVEPASAPAPRGQRSIRARAASAKRARVAPEHLDVGQPVMGEAHRLCALQVGVAGQDRVDVLGARVRVSTRADSRIPRLVASAGVAQVEREVGGDLVVARAPGVQPVRPPGRSARAVASRCSCGCLRGAGSKGNSPRSISAPICSRPETRVSASGAGTIPCVAEHARVRDRAADVVAGECPVEVDRRAEALDDGIGGRAEAPAPRLAAARGSVALRPHAGNLAVLLMIHNRGSAFG